MQQDSPPVFRDVILAGGGHAHVLLIRKWGMRPVPGVRVTLVSPEPQSPYSGMLPGLVAGHYGFDDIHIDLVRLCQWAGVRFVRSEITAINPAARQIQLAGRAPLEYDILSVDTGSTPNHDVPGVAEHAIPVKPIAGFWRRWQSLQESLRRSSGPATIAVVGGGAGSVEIMLAMASACRTDPGIRDQPAFHLLTRDAEILPGYPGKVRAAARQACKDAGVQVHESFPVARVDSAGLSGAGRQSLPADFVVWCTQAAAPGWPRQSGLDCDAAGFIAVNENLQSTSHPDVFAAGDVAHMVHNPRPKAGVYAVRQAPVLYDNICSLLLGRSLQQYRPQDNFLSLLSLGDKVAAGSRGRFSVSGKWVWRWKDRIDRRFMDRFENLAATPSMAGQPTVPEQLVPPEERGENLDSTMRCAGCGGKVGPQVLADVLQAIDTKWQPEDAVIQAWPAETIAQTIDQISAPFDDPWLLGRIAVFHALNDLLAINATPHSIQVALALPFAGRQCQQRELRLLLEGILSACQDEQVQLLGGHTSEGRVVSVCVSANGLPGEQTFRKQGIRKGDVLVLSKALGTGTILAGHMQGRTRGRHLHTALDAMNASNSPAQRALARAQVHACTDVSGFGLLGHLAEMLAGSPLRPALALDAMPLLPGAQSLAASGIYSTLLPQNESAVLATAWGADYRQHPLWPLLLDPQTAGGLLASVAQEAVPGLEAAGFCTIGRIA